MRVENFSQKQGSKQIPWEAKPLFARVAGELIGYNREVTELGMDDGSLVKSIELRQDVNDGFYTIVAKAENSVSGAGNKFMLEGCLEGIDKNRSFAPYAFDYNTGDASKGVLLGEFNFESITKRQEKYTFGVYED